MAKMNIAPLLLLLQISIFNAWKTFRSLQDYTPNIPEGNAYIQRTAVVSITTAHSLSELA